MTNKAVLFDLLNEKASERFSRQLAACISPGLILAFKGELGTGKTTIIRAMLRHLGVRSAIKSPTFSLVESYLCGSMQINHFDLYRIMHEEELDYLGFRDYFTDQSICCIEWPDRAGKALPKVDIQFNLTIKGGGREMHIHAFSQAGKKILTCLEAYS